MAFLNLLLCMFILGSSAQVPSEQEEDIFSLSLEELGKIKVITASKRSESVQEAPGVVTNLTAGEISRFGAANLSEILQRVVSFYPTGSNFFPQNVMAVRGDLLGHYDNHVLILLNGRPIREGYSGGVNFAIYNAFPINTIDRIEIIRGPGSVLYGTNAYSAVINIITKSPEESELSTNVGAGELGSRTASVTGGYVGSELRFEAGVRFFQEEGWWLKARDNNRLEGRRRMGEDNLGINLSAKMGKFHLNALYVDSDQDFIGSIVAWTGQPPLEDRKMASRRTFVDLGHESSMGETGEMRVNVSYGSMVFDHYNYLGKSEDLFLEVNHLWRLNDKIHLVYGLTAWHQEVGSESGLSAAPVPNFSTWWWNGYSEIAWKPNEQLKFYSGGQLNKPQGQDSDFVPRLGAIYSPNPRHYFKLMYSQAFRAAFGVETGFSLILTNPRGEVIGGLRGNPSLAPEKVATSEAEWGYHSDKVSTSLAYFFSEHDNLITRERAADGVIDFVNKGSLRVRGLELESRWTPTEHFYLTGSFASQANKSGNGLEDFTLVPNHMLKMGVSYANERINLGLFDTWFSAATDVVIHNPARQAINPPAEAHHLLSLLGTWKWGERYHKKVSLYGTNLLDEEVNHPEFIGRRVNTLPAAAPRSFHVQFGVSF